MYTTLTSVLLLASMAAPIQAQTPSVTGSSSSSSTSTGGSTITALGCYTDVAPLVNTRSSVFMTPGQCQSICTGGGQKHAVMAINGSDCWCGDTVPAAADLSADSGACSTPCPGYPTDICGGPHAWSVYSTGAAGGVGSSSTGTASGTNPINTTTTTTSTSTPASHPTIASTRSGSSTTPASTTSGGPVATYTSSDATQNARARADLVVGALAAVGVCVAGLVAGL